ncbi:hypothetical protein C7974DRAFT_399191 [Boeremia exigua]|uniref:uncharacterized protein n=1 Tax=Boeremia exigua TaxID=749465 RepID=UPI001E8ED545|nr:uncharacterized protein C7974DRAFT_399191 [Boeremia exigua]KAH6620236.1 hypothetical protein C7974DRAFT_399191 [Boeremia exigua]
MPVAKKQSRSRKGRVEAAETPKDNSLGYEALIEEEPILGPKGDNVRFSLTWKEKDGTRWMIAPIILPEHVEASEANDKRFMRKRIWWSRYSQQCWSIRRIQKTYRERQFKIGNLTYLKYHLVDERKART